jgi:hypothetical protein
MRRVDTYWQHGDMYGVQRATRALRRLTHEVAEFVRELNYWQRRATVLSMAPDRFLPKSNQPPDTYQEFLARTTGPLIREPSLRERQGGRQVG